VLVGYHRAWSPSSHTLVLAARSRDEVKLTNPDSLIPTLAKAADGTVTGANLLKFDQSYQSDLEAYSTEVQHLWQCEELSWVFGGRFQTGQADTFSRFVRDPLAFPPTLFKTTNATESLAAQGNTTDLERLSLYTYGQWQVLDPLRLAAGLSYDWLVFPQNIDLPPLRDGQRTEHQVSPKAGFIWTIQPQTHLRGVFARSLGGLYYDASVRLEPVQVAGFNQAFRSAIPESVLGQAPGAQFETWGLGLDHRFKTGTYLGVEGEILGAQGSRQPGVFDFVTRPATPGSVHEDLDYRERTVTVSVNQLLGEQWALGARYRLGDADLDGHWLELPIKFYPKLQLQDRAEGTLHQLWLYGLFNHRSGFFAKAESVWLAQSNRGYSPDQPGDDFWQFNFWVGYRFPRRVAELSVGLLNLTDRDYRLNPLNLHRELPRERTFAARLVVDF
jgi:hypothetical protein